MLASDGNIEESYLDDEAGIMANTPNLQKSNKQAKNFGVSPFQERQEPAAVSHRIVDNAPEDGKAAA